MNPLQQARRWIQCGRARAALELLDAEPSSAGAAEHRVGAWIVLDRLDEATAALETAERDYGVDDRNVVVARTRLNRVKVKPAVERARLAQALAAVARLPGEPHPNVYAIKGEAFGPGREMVVCPRPEARTVIVSLGLWLPMPAEDLLFTSMGWSAVHLPGAQATFRRDPLWVLENRDRVAEEIVEACATTGASRMVFTGCSGQGLGALGLGSRAGADAIVAYSPISSLDPNVLAALADLRREGSILTPVIASTERIIEVDALADLQKHPTETTVVFDPIHPFDSIHAYRLGQAEHVRLEDMPGEGHLTSQVAIADGLFQGFATDTLKRAVKRGGVGRHGLHRRPGAHGRSNPPL